jgi:ABC-type phosphate transport system permease subunit
MKKWVIIGFFLFFLAGIISVPASAQCSICTKTAQQLGEKPAKGLNSGILYLAFTPLIIVGFIGYKWWQSNKEA